MISETTIQKVRDLEIVDVLKGMGVDLKRRGATWFAHCPFHSERTPSFTVSAGKNVYYCQSCRRGGDAIGFVMEKEGLDFQGAVESIARANNVPIEYVKSEKSDEEREKGRRRESLLGAVAVVQQFFYDQLRVEMTEEAREARRYAYGRWPEEFCATAGLGLAPKDGRGLVEYCRGRGVSIEVLKELGVVKVSERGVEYSMFRNRLTIPIRDRLGRVIAWTARYLGDAKADGTGKYVNSSNSEVFVKGETVFGIDRAARCRGAYYFNIVEGAPDVLKMQSVGLMNTVATNGTAWTEGQFGQLKRWTEAVCFIPDSDVAKDGEAWGAGFQAVMVNGATAVRMGFHVTVRELPFRYVKGDDGEDVPQKNDADEYIHSKEIYHSIEESDFILWMAEKRFGRAESDAEKRAVQGEIAELLRHVEDKSYMEELVDGLSKIHGRPKFWRDAVAQARGEARNREREKGSGDVMTERDRDVALLRQFNLSIQKNSYYTYNGENDPTRLSNFILEPLYHIEDEMNGTRLFRMINSFGDTRMIELRESELCSLAAFCQRVSSLGNFVWISKADNLNKVKEYTYAKTRSARRIVKLGWDGEQGLFAWGNGVWVDGSFRRVNELGIVSDVRDVNYYLPATSSMYAGNAEKFQFERLMVHSQGSGVSLHSFAERLIEVFGEQAQVALCYLLSTIFRDIIYGKTRHFPILNLFGEKGSGKTTLATCLQSFFIHGIEPPNIGVTSVPAMNDRVSQAVNTMVVFDEYRNDLDVRKIQFFKGLWGGAGQTKKSSATDGMASQTIVSTGVALCGQDKPTQDMALFTRLIFLQYNRTVFSPAEQARCQELVALCNLGLTHLTHEVLSHRSLMEKNFGQAYALTKGELAAAIGDEEVHSRIFGNWVIPLATYRALETVLDLPFTYSQLFETALRGMRAQNEFAQESSEVADFWSTLQGLQSSGRCVENAHFRIKYMNRFRALSMKEDMIFGEARPILFVNAPAVAAMMSGNRGAASAGSNRSNWSTVLSYLKSHGSYLGLKQERFVILNAQGSPDYAVEQTTFGVSRRQKVNRPKALCFDYLQLKEAFGLTLETEVVSDGFEDFDDDGGVGPEGVAPF